MTRKSSWNITFGRTELLILVLVYLFSVIAIYIVGYRAGNETGFDIARSGSTDTLVKFPIENKKTLKLDPEKVSEIYARLSDRGVKALPAASSSVGVITGIKTVEEAPLQLPEFESKYLKVKVEPGYYAQVFSGSDLQLADSIVGKLKALGFMGVINGDLENGYRVLVGPESTSTYAERLINQLDREKISPEPAILQQIK